MHVRVQDDWKDLLKFFGDEHVTCECQCHKTFTAGPSQQVSAEPLYDIRPSSL